MIPLSPSLLIAAANSFVGFGQDGVVRALAQRGRAHVTGRTSQPGVLAECFLREVWAGPGGEAVQRWDTAFVHHVGYWSHYSAEGGKSSWPLAPSATSDELAALAERQGAIREEPEPGDLFLLWSPARKAFFRTGIVVSTGHTWHTEPDDSRYRECVTIEGDSGPTMGHSGGMILRHKRRLAGDHGDRFVRWTALDARAARAREAVRPEDITERIAA